MTYGASLRRGAMITFGALFFFLDIPSYIMLMVAVLSDGSQSSSWLWSESVHDDSPSLLGYEPDTVVIDLFKIKFEKCTTTVNEDGDSSTTCTSLFSEKLYAYADRMCSTSGSESLICGNLKHLARLGQRIYYIGVPACWLLILALVLTISRPAGLANLSLVPTLTLFFLVVEIIVMCVAFDLSDEYGAQFSEDDISTLGFNGMKYGDFYYLGYVTFGLLLLHVVVEFILLTCMWCFYEIE